VEALTEQNRHVPIVIYFDGADQTYRKEENIPKLSFFDRPRFVKRKLEMAFPSYPIRASLQIKPQGKNAKTANGDLPSYLFVALPETEHLDKIGAGLLEAGVPVAGFGLLPIESAGLVAELARRTFSPKSGEKASRWAVLIGQHETGGLRQVVVKDGNLSIARLTPPSEAGMQGSLWVEEVLREFKGTLTYLSRLGYSPTDGLDVVVICSDVDKQFFDQKALPVTNFTCLKTADALLKIGSKGVSIDKNNFADALHAAWMSKKRALILPVQVPSIHRIMAPRKGARTATMLFLLTALGLGAYTVNEYQNYLGVKNDIESTQSQEKSLEREYAKESKVFDSLPVKIEVVKGVLAVKKTLDTNTVAMGPYLTLLYKVMSSDIKFTQLSVTHQVGEGLKLEHAEEGTVAGKKTAPPALSAQAVNDRGMIKMVLRFKLPSSLSLEQKLARTDVFVDLLQRTFQNYDVKVTTPFGNVTSTGIFEGIMGGEATAVVAAPSAGESEFAEIQMEGVPL
jgi:hypothetical protein